LRFFVLRKFRLEQTFYGDDIKPVFERQSGEIVLADVWLQIALSIISWLHLFATVAWIGAMTMNVLVLLPSIRETLEPAAAGKFLGAVMRRFRRLVYGSIILLVFSGVVMTALNKSYLGPLQLGNAWTQVILIKHVFVVVLVVLAIYALEVLAPNVAKIGAKGPSPELARLQKLQLRLAGAGFVLGLIILLLTGFATALSALP